MGYTIENKKIVIWTEKVFVADPYPFNDEGDNHTFFYKNLKDRQSFASCLSILSEYDKQEVVMACLPDLRPDTFILKSKKSYFKQRFKNKTK